MFVYQHLFYYSLTLIKILPKVLPLLNIHDCLLNIRVMPFNLIWRSCEDYFDQLLTYDWLEDHGWQRAPNPPYFMKTPLYCLPSVFQILSPLPFFLVASNPQPTDLSVFFVSLAEWVIVPHLVC